MSTYDWKIERQLCRCCHSEGTFKSLTSECSMENDAGTFSDILRNCLTIELTPVSELLTATTNSICEVCISRLQDAYSFKKQVLMCEKHFQNLYSRNCISAVQADIKIKQEITDSDEADFGSINDDFKDFPCIDEVQPKREAKLKKVTQKQIGVKKCQKVTKDKPAADEVGKSVQLERETKREKVTQKRVGARKRQKLTKDEPVADDERGKSVKEHNIHFRLSPSDYERVGNSLKCMRCEKTFALRKGLCLHIKRVHMEIKTETCTLCNKSFCSISQFTRHKLTEHSIDDRVKCNACEKLFYTRKQLLSHQNTFHMLGVKYSCQHCDYVSYSSQGINRHKFMHKTVKEYHCQYCKKSFMRKNTLDFHERIHTGDRRQVCKECGQAFVQKASLNYHMARYHPGVKF